jgi:hypothetical protein
MFKNIYTVLMICDVIQIFDKNKKDWLASLQFFQFRPYSTQNTNKFLKSPK